jgi:hypothetical protein
MDAVPTNANTESIIPPDILADLEAVCRQVRSGGVRDPELLRRVAERAAAARREILATHGVRDLAVDLIREIRDEG